MKGRVLVNDLTVRNAMTITTTSDTQVNLNMGDVVYGTVIGNWLAYNYVYRAGNIANKEVFQGTRYSAIKNPTNTSQVYIEVTEGSDVEPVPAPEQPVPNPLPVFEIVFSGTDYEVVKVEQSEGKIVIQIRPLQ